MKHIVNYTLFPQKIPVGGGKNLKIFFICLFWICTFLSLNVRALKHHFFGGKETVHKETTRPDNFSLNLLTTR